MAKKNKILLLDFDEIQGSAINDFLLGLGDFEPVMKSSFEDKINEISKLSLIIQNLTEQNVQIENGKYEIPILTIENRNTKSKFPNQEIIKSPFRLQQLEVKIRAILRQRELNALENLSIFGNSYVAARHALVGKDGEELKLTEKEVEIIAYLNQARPNCVSREELLREVWRYNEGVTTHTLETHIYRLRQKLSTLLGDKEALITDEGGYKLIG